MILLLLFMVAIAGLCALAFAIAVYALPFMIGVEVTLWAFHGGAGAIGAGLIGLLAGAVVLRVLAGMAAAIPQPFLRLAILVVFAAPASAAGYALVHGVAQQSVPSQTWQMAFSILGGCVTGASALMRLFGTVRE